MRKNGQPGREVGQFTVMAGADGEVESGLFGLRKRNGDDSGAVERFDEAVAKGIRFDVGADQLNAFVVFENRNDVEQPVQRRDVVCHQQHCALGADRRPA